MSVTKWNPFREFSKVPSRLEFFGRDWETLLPATTWNPSVDILENGREVIVTADLPGVSANNIELSLQNNILTVRGERHFEKETKEENYRCMERQYGSFSRSFALPVVVNEDTVTAEYKDGILKVVLPKREERKLRPIKVAVA